MKQKDPGIEAIGKIYRDLQIDTQWSRVFERGFVWWGHHHAQSVWADPPVEEDGLHISKVHAETDFLKYPERSASVETSLTVGMMTASMSGLVADRQARTINLYCNAFVHEENLFWLVSLLQTAILLQNHDATTKAYPLAHELGWEPTGSSHPTSGIRTEKDSMLDFVDPVVILAGMKPVEAISPDMFHGMSSDLSNSGLICTADDDGLSAFVPFGGGDALFRATIRDEHPELGHGFLLSLSLPPEVIGEAYDINSNLILELNRLEKETTVLGHFLGSWCLAPDRGRHKATAAYVTFIPAMACNHNVFVNMVISNLNHCRWAGETLFGDRSSRISVGC
jgi:hypothetical protein